MNKKFFTLLVAFLTTISFGAFAQITAGSVGTATSYSSSKNYLLETKAGNYLTVTADGKLVTITSAQLANYTYSQLQTALWKVTATPGSSGSSVSTMATYEFLNLSGEVKLALSTDNAATTIPNPADGANTVGGDIDVWIASSNTITPQTANYFYVTTKDQAVISMGANASAEVVPVKYTNLAALQTAATTALGIDLSSYQTAVTTAQANVDDAQEVVNDVLAASTRLADVRTAIAALDPVTPDYTEVNAASVNANAALTTASITPLINIIDVDGTAGKEISDLEAELTASESAVASALTTANTNLATANTNLTNAQNDLADAGVAADAVISITPRFAKGDIVLSANDINTYLGAQGVHTSGTILATEDSYIKLNFAIANTYTSPFTGELQAQAVYYSTKANGLVSSSGLYNDAYKVTSNQWVALKVKKENEEDDDQYLVVDTLSTYDGTNQVSTTLPKTTTDELFADGRLADSYMYQFQYDAENDLVNIISRAYLHKKTNNLDAKKYQTWNPAEADPTTNTYLYYYTYSVPAGTAVVSMNYLTYAELAYNETTNAVVYTYGKQSSKFKIFLKASSWYTPTRIPTGVYILKVIGENKDNPRIGKTIKLTLDGYVEYVDHPRQNMQHIPSAQWVVESSTSNRASFINREFANYSLGLSGRTTYTTGNDKEFFTLGGDTIQWEAVTSDNLKDKNLGYKYIGEDEFGLNKFTFRYLHDLSMNKPVEIKTDDISSLAVSTADNAAYFRLEEVLVDTYGYAGNVNGKNITGVSDLERAVYKVAVYNAISYDEEKLYVTYNATSKKYHLTDDEYRAAYFYLKENNEVPVEGADNDCYYIFVEANIIRGDFVELKLNSNSKYEVISTLNGGIVKDDYLAENDRIIVFATQNEDDEWVPVEYTNAASVPTNWYSDESGVNWNNYAVNSLDNNDGAYYARLSYSYGWTSRGYALSKVAVDPNTLALVHGSLDDDRVEIANSAFKVKQDDSIIYRTLVDEDGEKALEQNIRIYRTNATLPEYLYEDANSIYSSQNEEGTGKGPNPINDKEHRESIADQINFLGVEGKGDDVYNIAPLIARYVRGTVMPQYILMVDYKNYPAEEAVCPVCGDEPQEGCIHHESKDGFSTARVLVSFVDTISYYTTKKDKETVSKFKWNDYTRLGFVDAMFTHGKTAQDSIMTIVGTNLTTKEDEANQYVVKFSKEETAKEGSHKPVFFSLRLIEEGNDDFMLESDGTIGGMNANIWVKVQNGVPVLSRETSFSDAIKSEAERWNLKTTTDIATSNEGISEGKFEVTTGFGTVTIKGAANKQVVVTNILGKVVANVTLGSDYETISVPAGVVVVSVEGEATKALVK